MKIILWIINLKKKLLHPMTNCLNYRSHVKFHWACPIGQVRYSAAMCMCRELDKVCVGV